jgi:hypothetical protein
MNTNKFTEDLQQGNLGEKVIAKWLEKYKGYKTIKFGNTSDYDFVTQRPDGKQIMVECKTDRWEKYNYETGNIFIETHCNGRLSGLWSTMSEIYVFYFPDYGEIYMVKTDDLKSLIRRPDICSRRTMSGDRGAVSGFVMNRYKHGHLLKRIDIPVLKCWSDEANPTDPNSL